MVNIGDASIPAPFFATVQDKVLEELGSSEERVAYLESCFNSEFNPVGMLKSGSCMWYNSGHPKRPTLPPAGCVYRTLKVEFRKGMDGLFGLI